MNLGRRGITILALLIWVIIIVGIVVYAPKIYDYYVTGNTESLIKANVESVENEIKTQLIDTHPIMIWNNIDNLIADLKLQNPVTRSTQIRNDFDVPGAVVVYFNGVNTFTIDGISPDGSYLDINIILKQ